MGRRQVQKNGKMWEFFGWITKVCGWYVCEGVALLLATVTLVLHVCSWNSLVHCIFGPMPLCSDTSLVHCIFGPMHCNAKFWCPNYKGYSIKLQMGSRELWALNPTTFPRSHCFTEMTTLGNLLMPRQKCKCAPISAMGIRRSSSVVYRLSALAPSISSGESH